LKPLLRLLVIVAAAMLGPMIVPVRANVDLAPKWKAGEETVFTFTSDSTRRDAVPAMQAKQEQRTRQEMTIRRRVVQTGASGTTLELVFERIKVVVTQGRMFMLFDSARPPDADRSNVLEDAAVPMIGVPIRVVLNSENAVTQVSGFPQPRTVDGTVRPLIVDEEMVRNSLAAMYGMQKKPPAAKVGDRWSVDEELPGETGTVLAIRHQRRLESADATEAVIASTATAEIKIVTPGTHPQRLLTSFECTSTHHWDHTKGRLGWMVLEQKIESTGTIKQARSDHLSTVRMTLASEGFTPPQAKDRSEDLPDPTAPAKPQTNP